MQTETIGRRIRRLRKKKRMTQDKLAGKLYVSRATVSNWEHDNSLPDIMSVVRMSGLFNVSLDYLLIYNTDIKTL